MKQAEAPKKKVAENMPSMWELETASALRRVSPFKVEPSIPPQPYKFAVVGTDGKAVAFSATRDNAQHWCDELNEKGYIEDVR